MLKEGFIIQLYDHQQNGYANLGAVIILIFILKAAKRRVINGLNQLKMA